VFDAFNGCFFLLIPPKVKSHRRNACTFPVLPVRSSC
jgi:hypothetical protein